MKALRIVIGAVGLAAIAFGGLTLLDGNEIVAVVPWIVGPVLIHDLVIGPLIIGLVWLGTRFLPHYSRTPAMVGLVVSGSLTLVALSVVGRQGAAADNPSLLNRNYLAGWLVALALTWFVVGLTILWQRSHGGFAAQQ